VPSDGDHPIALTVAARDVVAHDQDVVAYTLAASDGHPLPQWHPGCPHRCAPAQRSDPAILAVR
jgi:hypothetical protein